MPQAPKKAQERGIQGPSWVHLLAYKFQSVASPEVRRLIPLRLLPGPSRPSFVTVLPRTLIERPRLPLGIFVCIYFKLILSYNIWYRTASSTVAMQLRRGSEGCELSSSGRERTGLPRWRGGRGGPGSPARGRAGISDHMTSWVVCVCAEVVAVGTCKSNTPDRLAHTLEAALLDLGEGGGSDMGQAQ